MAGIEGREIPATTAKTNAQSRTGRGEEERNELCAAAAAATPDEIESHNFQFGLREQIVYHAMREQALARLSRFLTGLQVFLGTSAIASMADFFPGWEVALVTSSALAGVMLLVIDPAGAARDHRALRSRFHNIFADLEEGSGDTISLRTLKARKERIMADAPPAYRGVQAVAYNAAVNATYEEAEAARHRYKIGRLRRTFANWLPMRGFTFEKEIKG